MSKWTFRCLLFTLAGLSMGVRVLVPMFPRVGAVFDDELMVWMTRNILDGKWVGDYSNSGHLILSKPVGYPLFLVATKWIPLSPVNVIHALLLVFSLIIVRELRFLGATRGRCVFYFALFVLYPPWFNEEMSRIYRDSLLVLIAVVFVAATLFLRRKVEVFLSNSNLRSMSSVVLASLCCGATAGWFVITKPSWHMLVGFLTLTLLSVVWTQRLRLTKAVLVSIASVGVVTLMTVSVVGSVVFVNKSNYGVAVLDSFANGSFPRAMRAIYSLPDSENRPYVDVTQAMRLQGYKVSPTFKKLEKFLEQPDNVGWRGVACGHQQLGEICDESAGWFVWDLRAAIDASKLGITAKEFEEINYQIAIEIEDACSRELLQCDSRGIAPGLDSLDSLDWRLVIDAMFSGLGHLSRADFGERERFSQSNAYPGASDLWPNTINGFPRIEYASSYELNNQSLIHVRSVMARFYQVFLYLGLIVSLAALFYGGGRRSRAGNETSWRLLGVGSWLSVLILMFQLSLLEASSGLYMTIGGYWYLLPASPFLLFAIVCGVEHFMVIFETKRATSNCSVGRSAPK